jgi:ADP-heptose:LPS heptosyltransferase
LTVAEELTRIGRRVVWCAGPAEEGLSLPANAERLPLGSLVALAERLANAKLYVGNDSGITHLAAAAGCPTVAIFGPTDPRVWAPRGPRVRVVQGQPWPETAVVMGAIGELVDRPD